VQGSEPVAGGGRRLVPRVNPCQIDVLPPQRRDALEQMVGNDTPVSTELINGPTEINGVPMHDGAGGAGDCSSMCISEAGTIAELRLSGGLMTSQNWL